MSATRRRLTALLTAVLALALIGLVLASTSAPTASSVKAAVVNQDQMVELGGQMVPMGRQLAAELVKQDSRFDWEITTADLAATGLSDGTYAVVVSIPEEFSKNLTSLAGVTGPAAKSDATVEQGKITVEAQPGATEDQKYAIESVTQAAATALGHQVSDTFVSGLMGGLTQMQTQLGEAAKGAGQLADGTVKADDGLTQLDQGAGQLADGAGAASQGISELAAGTGTLVSGIGSAADGAQLLADNTQTLADGMVQLGAGSGQVSTQVGQGIDQFGTQMTAGASAFVQGNNGYIDQAVKPTAQTLQAATGAIEALCASADPANATQQAICSQFPPAQLEGMNQLAAGTLAGADGVVAGGNALVAGIPVGVEQLKQGVTSGIDQYGALVSEAADGAGKLAAGSQEFASQLATAGTQAQALVSGAQQAADGVSQLAKGATALADGTGQAAAGMNQLSTGVTQLADGLGQAVDQIPSFTDDQISQLVVGITAPVATPTVAPQGSGVSAQAIATFAAMLWLMTFALALVFPAFAAHLVESVRPSVRLAFAAWWAPAAWSAGIGAVAGIILGRWAEVDGSKVAALALVGAVAAASFYAVNQALAAALGVAGRIVSIGMFGIALSAAVTATGSTALSSLAAFLPAGLAGTVASFLVIPGSASGTRALVGLVVWALGAFAVTVWATARRRAKPGSLTREATA